MTELMVGTKKGLFALEGDAGGAFEVTARAFAGEPVENAVRDPRSGRVHRLGDSPFYGPKLWFADDPGGRVGAGERRRAARRAATSRSSASGRSRPARPTACCTPAAIPACCSRAATAGGAGSSTAACGSTRRRPDWQPGGGGLCLHSIATWPGDPDRLAVGVSAAGVWLP